MWGRPVFFRVPKSRPSHPYMNSLFSYFFDFFTFFVKLYRIIGEVVFGKKKMHFFSFGAHAVVRRKRLKTSLA